MNKKSFLWKLYFWIITILYIYLLGLVCLEGSELLSENLFSDVYNLFIIIIGITSLLGIRGYIYEKRYFSKDIWVFIFSISLIDFIGTLIFEFNTIFVQNIIYVGVYICIIILFLPCFFALYKYTFKMNELWSTND